MPSLRDQLQNLQQPVSRSLGVEKERASLLFERKEAAAFSTEEFYNLGLAGLEQLRKVDRALADYEEKLFDSSSIILNRAILSKDENDELNESLNRMIVYLAPYFNHQGCKQVLEWLIYKYHIHLYNAPVVANAFFVYHSTNSFGRLLKILKIDRPEWEFSQEFAKEALPIPFGSILKACLKGGSNHFLIASYSTFLQRAIQLVGEEYIEEKLQAHFTFFASIVVHLFEDTANITEQLISRVIPFVGSALKSKVLPFKLSGFMIVSDLVMNTTLSEEVLANVLKLTLLKMRQEWFDVAMNVILIICQRQNIKSLPKKAFMKLLRKGDDLNLNSYLTDAVSNFELTGFILPFVNTAFECLSQGEDMDEQNLIANYVKVVLNLETMNDTQASATINACVEHFLTSEEGQIPEALRLLMKQISIRFVQAFDAIRAKMMITDKEVLDRFLEQCEISEHEIGVLNFEDKKKRRRRSSQSRTYDEDKMEVDVTEKPVAKKSTGSKEQLKALHEGGDIQKAFKKPPSVVLKLLEDAEIDSGKLEWALRSFESDKYLSKQSTDELEDFFVGVVKFICKNPKSDHKSLLKQSLQKVKLSDNLLLPLISPHEEETKAKKGRFAKSSSGVLSVFSDETDEEFELRLTVVLEVYNSSTELKATPDLVQKLFNLIEITEKAPKNYPTVKNPLYIQQLTLSLICNCLKGQDSSELVDKQTHFDSLVNVIRFTHDPIVLRNALKVLTCVAPLIPTQLTAQIMSLFAFMGDGLLKKDNELTLMVVEESLHALFSAILTAHASQPVQYQRRLLEVSQIFAKSLPDIPAHRRARILNTLATCILPTHLWIIFAAIFDNLCTNWKKSKDQPTDPLSDICLDFIATIQPEHQLQLVLNILEYVISLGGDSESKASATMKQKKFPTIFDRKDQSSQKLRHYRYMVIGFVMKALNQSSLYEQFAKLTDDEIYERISPFAYRLLELIAELGDYTAKELAIAERNKTQSEGAATVQVKTLKYWVSLSARTDNIIKKLSEMLPEKVRIQILVQFVEDPEVDEELKKRAPKLMNVKLPSEEDKLSAEEESESFEDQLNNLVDKMNAAMEMPSKLTELSVSLEKLLAQQDATDQIEELAPQMFPLFFELFNIRQRTYEDSTHEDISNSEKAISAAFISLAESLPEEELKPVFSQLSDWVEEALKPGAEVGLCHRLLTVYNFVNRFYDHFNNLAVNYFDQLFVYTPKILKQLNIAKTAVEELLLNGKNAEDSSNKVVDQLIVSVVDFINNCAKHSFFMGEERTELVYEAVLDQIENRKVSGYTKRCIDHLVPCIYQLSESAPDLFMTSICNKLLDKMHVRSSRVRLHAVMIFEKLVNRIGDGLAPMLATITQYLSELLEDPDTKVAEQCDLTIRQLRNVFGDDILNDR